MSDRDAFVKDLITDPLQWLFNELHENWSFDLGEDCSPRAQGSTLDPRIDDYHERTRAQVRHRDRRDRDLQAAGWRLMHFSGSEFHRNPAKCVDEVWSASWGTRVDGRRIPDRITVDYQEMFPCPTE